MPSIRISRMLRSILLTLMQEFPSKNSQTSLLHFQRNKIFHFIIRFIDLIERWYSFRNFRSAIQLSEMASRQPPKASIFLSCILKWNPKAQQSIRLSIQKCRILMDIYSSSNLRRFENSHRLHYQRVIDSNFIAKLFYPISVCNISKDLIVLMKCMTNFINRISLRNSQFTILPSFFLEEEADFAGR